MLDGLFYGQSMNMILPICLKPSNSFPGPSGLRPSSTHRLSTIEPGSTSPPLSLSSPCLRLALWNFFPGALRHLISHLQAFAHVVPSAQNSVSPPLYVANSYHPKVSSSPLKDTSSRRLSLTLSTGQNACCDSTHTPLDHSTYYIF